MNGRDAEWKSSFSVPEARAIVADLFTHNPRIYFADMLCSLTVGYACATVYMNAPLLSWQQIACFFIGGFALFRGGSFIHEIVHLRSGEMRAFQVTWNLLAGIPMLMPSSFYGNHIDHHNSHHYGTGQDGEYLPLGTGSRYHVMCFFGQVIFLPLAVLLRFLVVTPISLLHPRLRSTVLERASSFVINLHYRRRKPVKRPAGFQTFIEIACFLRSAALVGEVLGGWAPPQRWILLYVFAVFVLGLNYIRNLVAHHYRSTGEAMSHEEQLLDSVNLTGGWLTELFFPLGLRYHALHHLFPALPYHNLGAAHHRLMAKLPAVSAYRDTVYPSYWSVVRELLQDMRISGQTAHLGSELWYSRRDIHVHQARPGSPGPNHSRRATAAA